MPELLKPFSAAQGTVYYPEKRKQKRVVIPVPHPDGRKGKFIVLPD